MKMILTVSVELVSQFAHAPPGTQQLSVKFFWLSGRVDVVGVEASAEVDRSRNTRVNQSAAVAVAVDENESEDEDTYRRCRARQPVRTRPARHTAALRQVCWLSGRVDVVGVEAGAEVDRRRNTVGSRCRHRHHCRRCHRREPRRLDI